jgi:hypothetical protein
VLKWVVHACHPGLVLLRALLRLHNVINMSCL